MKSISDQLNTIHYQLRDIIHQLTLPEVRDINADNGDLIECINQAAIFVSVAWSKAIDNGLDQDD